MNPPEYDELVGRTVLGRYRIVHRLAAGGMGVIYLARSEGAKGFVKPVVIKRILPHLVGDEGLVAMFAREARIMSNLSHPGIVTVLDFTEEDGAYLMVLEYVHGFHLGRWHRYVRRTRGLFPIEPAIHIVISVLEALHYAHTLTGPDGQPLHIVHRDVSPGNVLVDIEGRIKLTDFGIARMRTDKTSETDKRALKGTFSYMAPELLKLGEPSPRSDLYSCAVLLHELLTGKNEFSAKDVALTAWRVLEHVPSRIESLRPEVPPGLDDVLARALLKNPEERYDDAAAFARELRRVRGIGADEAARVLSEGAAKDFNDPEMAEALKATDLTTLDRKWRDRPSKRFSFRPSLRSRRSEPSVPPTKTTLPLPNRIRRIAHRRGLLAGLAVGMVAAAAVAGTLVLRRKPPDAPPPGVILVEGSVSAVDVAVKTSAPAAESAAPAVAPGQPADPPTTSATGEATPKKSPPKSRSEMLTRAFARQQTQIARCFSQNASDISGSPEIAIRFEVGTDGHVISAQVQPAALASTPLGGCLTGVARSTDFGPQPEPTPFRIPITAKRGK